MIDFFSWPPTARALWFLALCGLGLLFSHNRFVQGLDDRIYDRLLPALDAPLRSHVGLIAIDEASLIKLGRWPWPRQTHAKLLDRLSEAQSGPVVWDVLFAESSPDDPILADSIRKHGKVHLALHMKKDSSGLSAVPPTAMLKEAAHSLGHVHFPLDADGLVRRVALQISGTEPPSYPALALSVLATQEGAKSLDATLSVGREKPLIPFSSQVLSVPTFSYHDILSGKVPPAELTGRTLFIGATAAGLGDALPVPLTLEQSTLPGVYIHLNVYEALQHEGLIHPPRPSVQYLTLLISLLIITALYPRLPPHQNLLLSLALSAGLLVLSAGLLVTQRYWLAPSSTLLCLLAAYPLWTWQRFRHLNHYLSQELQRLHRENLALQSALGAELTAQSAVRHPSQTRLEQQIGEVQAATQALNRLQHLIHDTLEHLPEGAVLCQVSGEILYLNERAACYLGPSVRPTVNLLSLLQTQSTETSAVNWRDLFQQIARSPGDLSRTAEWQNGEQSYAIKIAPLLRLIPRGPALIVSFTDITPMRQAQRERLETLHFISHDLRSPLSSQLALLDRLRRQEPPALSTEALDDLEKLGRRSLDLADRFLQLAKVEAQQEIHLEPCLMVDVLDNACDSLQALAKAREITLSNHIQPGLEERFVLGNAALLERCLINLLDNALKHSPPQTKVDIDLYQRDLFLRITVRDEGPGLSVCDQNRLFQAFERSLESEKQGINGIGLGLRFVKTVTERHQGRVGVESQVGEGACFWMELPLNAPSLALEQQ